MDNSKSKSDEESETVTIKDVDAFIQKGYKTFQEGIKIANAFPSGREYNFMKTCEDFSKDCALEETHILGVINKVLREYDIEGNIKNKSMDDKTELLIEANDVILDRAYNIIDELNGLKKLPSAPVIQAVSAEVPINGSWNRLTKVTVNQQIKQIEKPTDAIKSFKLITAKNIIRPQTYFKDKIDNRSNYPWKPRILEKPNSLKPLALYVESTETGEVFSHPYEVELEKFTPPEECLDTAEEIPPKPVKKTPLIEVNDEESLNKLLEDLRTHKEIAIDLEHHSYRSFMGITCLMQISTEDTDYIVDTLALRDKLHVLNEVFTRPSIVKIFHGAVLDIDWLQRDLSLYVVNMFDTYQASKVLGYPKLSLAYLLQKFCSVSPNKQFQLADWRIRPLPEELKMYAREDTHYLIYIYHKMKNELLKKGNGSTDVLLSVFGASTQVCQHVYIKSQLTETSHLNLYHKCSRLFDNRQMFALKELYSWRDKIAREEDESYGYVLPNHMMLEIAEILPREIQGILALCSPIPPIVKGNIIEIHKIVLNAREQPLVKPIFQEDNRKNSAKEAIKVNVDIPLNCPHDLTNQEFQEDLPTLLNHHLKLKILDSKNNCNLEKTKPNMSVFKDDHVKTEPKNFNAPKFMSPFERYTLVKPFLIAEEEKAKKSTINKNADPSVEDRIASLHEHFIRVKESVKEGAKIVKKKVETITKSVLEMGGTKKRKRDHGESEVISLNNQEEDDNNYDDFQKRNPNYFNNKNDSSAFDNDFYNKDNRNNYRGNRNKGNRGHGAPGQSRKRKRDDNSNEAPENKKHNFKPFDYSQVDYSQFQGGGNRANKTDYKMKYKQKGKKNFGGKQNNKSFSFQNKQPKGKRGR